MDRLPQENTRRPSADHDPSACQESELTATAESALAAHGAWFGGPMRGPTAEERLARLVRTIESDIIPKLVQAHRSADRDADGADAPGPDGNRRLADVDPALDARDFAHRVLRADDSEWIEPVERLRARGCSLESIYLDLLAPAARELGDLWTQDLCSFSDVTIGTGRLQQVMRHLSQLVGEESEHPTDGRRALLLPAPGEQHTFGITMVADFFTREGWEVVGGAARPGLDPVTLVSKEWFDVVGFSLGHVARFDALAMMVSRIRQVSRNRSIGILAGGPALSEHPELVERLGADATALDGRQAPRIAEQLLSQRVKRRP
jgi:MerR family transcriptional regulator, light-induced transcriptional regulator